MRQIASEKQASFSLQKAKGRQPRHKTLTEGGDSGFMKPERRKSLRVKVVVQPTAERSPAWDKLWDRLLSPITTHGKETPPKEGAD